MALGSRKREHITERSTVRGLEGDSGENILKSVRKGT